MMDTFYLGTLEIVFQSPIPMNLQEWDKKFQKPVLPITRRIYVNLKQAAVLPSPTGDFQKAPQLSLWKGDGEEYRLYHAGDTRQPFLLSHRREHRITIYMVEEIASLSYASFRPWFYIHMEELLLEQKGLLLHAASIIYRGQCICFSAPSGTGKTTQTDLWHQHLNQVSDLNGDRTLLQQTNQGWFGCGFPVFGSTVRCEQAAVPLFAIVIVRRGKKNQIMELSISEKIKFLYSEMTIFSWDSKNVAAALSLLEDLVSNVTVLQLNCTMTKNAVSTLYHYLYGENDGNI